MKRITGKVQTKYHRQELLLWNIKEKRSGDGSIKKERDSLKLSSDRFMKSEEEQWIRRCV